MSPPGSKVSLTLRMVFKLQGLQWLAFATPGFRQKDYVVSVLAGHAEQPERPLQQWVYLRCSGSVSKPP